jgi:hypothetical protein
MQFASYIRALPLPINAEYGSGKKFKFERFAVTVDALRLYFFARGCSYFLM